MSSRQLDEEAIFHFARDLTDAEKRETYLDQICAGDQALRERVERLLDVHEKEQSFLKSNGAVEPTVDHSPITEAPGQTIGRYKLLQKIGEGGFGVVYMAEQSRPVRRKVALKIIKPGMDTHAVVARFEAERQALALMDHPNIARVLDGGATASGRPYFVMELVKGVPITEYCDKNQLATEDRLKLFMTVCPAVQHAHQKGIIHRDLKPSNVLVTLHDGQPVVKVIDFGVAKATNQQLTEKTLFTAYGQMVGTPQYMSPEQAEMSGLDVDTRSDIYSLGVLLYELLTGTTPLETERLRTAGYAEMQRLIREEEPPKPSTRLSTSGEHLTVIAKDRSLSPEQLQRTVRGDLDWIVMKALEKDRNRRFETPNSLAKDVASYLASEPIDARPPTLGYRLRKFVRRNRAVLAATSVVGLALITATAMSTWFALEAIHRKNEALEAQQVAKANERDARLAETQAREKTDKANRLLNQLLTEIRHKAVVRAMMGDEPGTLAAISQADEIGVAEAWKHVILGQLAIYRGDPSEAVNELDKALQREPDNTLAKVLRGKARGFLGYSLDDTLIDTQELRQLSETSSEEQLFIAEMFLYQGGAEKAVRITNDYLKRHNNAVGRLIRAEAYLQLASERQSLDDLRLAERDFSVVSELMPRNPLMLFSGIRIHGWGYRFHKLNGDMVEKNRHEKVLRELLQRSDGLEFAPVHYVAAWFHDSAGEYAPAHARWRKAHRAGLAGYWLAAYACFLHRMSDEFLDVILAELEGGGVWTECQRVVLGLDERTPALEVEKQLCELARRDVAFVLRMWPVRILYLLGLRDSAQGIAQEILEDEPQAKIGTFYAELAYLAGDEDAGWLKRQEFVSPGQAFNAQSGVGFRMIGTDQREQGIEQLQRLANTPYGGPFRDFVATVVQRAKVDPAWPPNLARNINR